MDRKKIPNTENFHINQNGDVFDPNGSKRKTYVNGDGYRTVSVKLCDGRWVTFGVHRLLALVFVPNDNKDRTEVNHRDWDIGNNDVSNLEWVTPGENNIHAEIMRTDNLSDSVHSSKNGLALKKYKNAHTAAVDNNCSALDVWDSIKEGIKINEVTFHFQKQSKARPPVLRHDRTKNFRKDTRCPAKAIKMLNIDTGEQLEFKSILEAARAFGVSPSHVYQSISKNSYPRVFLKKYQVQYMDKDFPVMTLEELRRAKEHGAKQVIAYNVLDEKYYTFISATDFISRTGLSKKAVTTTLVKNKVRVLGNWIPMYLNPDNLKQLKSHVSRPVETRDSVPH